MEINITSLLEEDMFPFSHSAAEGGQNAGRNTWQAALDGPRPLLNSPEEFAAFRDHVRDFGAWDDEEIDGWSENECKALFLQMIAGDCRECPRKLEPEEHLALMKQSAAGQDLPDGRISPELARRYFRHLPRASSLDEIDWEAYEIEAEAGRISGNLFRTDSGEVFYSLSH